MSSKKLKILIVDDNKNFLKTFEKTLADKGCIVASTSQPGEACQMVLNDIFHIVFIDCILLSEQGIELANRIRQVLGSSLEIVMMSGIVSEESITNFSSLNICEFLKKPFSNRKLEEILRKVQKKYIQGASDSFLKNVFSENFSNDLFLQKLINLQEISPAEFFLLLGGIFKSREDMTFSVSLDRKTSGRIFFQKGLITGFELDKGDFLTSLVSKGWLTAKDGYRMAAYKLKRGVNFPRLIEEGVLSPYQTHTFQLQQLVEFLHQIIEQKTVTINTKLFKTTNNYLEVDESLLADRVFPFLKNLQQGDLEKILDKNVMTAGFVFRPSKTPKKYMPAVQPIVDKIKEGLRVLAIQSEMSLEQRDYYSSLLYILLKGEVYCVESSGDEAQSTQYLIERYKKIYEFLSKKSAKEIFGTIGNLSQTAPTDMDSIGNIYRMFLRSNHIDRFSMNLPQEVVKSINNVTIKLKQIYNNFINPKVQEDEDEKVKAMRQTIAMSQNRQLCKAALEKKDYKKAFVIINKVSKKDLRKDPTWMLLYIWLGIKAPNCDIDRDALREFKASIGLAKMSLMQNPLYFYVLGLLFLSQENDQKAIMFLSRSKELDMTFQPAFEEYKKAVMKQKSKKKGIFSKYFHRKKEAG